MIRQVLVNSIDESPFQARTQRDPEKYEQLKASIKKVGLLQPPTGREADGRIQLAFGNTRLAVHKELELEYMTIDVRPLSDLEMFQLGIRENLDREELGPMDAARAMILYRDQFGKTSKETGELFSCNESTVRNKIRLLSLPEAVQAQVASGEITEGVARSLLTVQKIAPAQVAQVAQELASSDYDNPGEAVTKIKRQLNYDKTITILSGSWDSGTPMAGTGLWELASWRPSKPIKITPKKFFKIFPQHLAQLEAEKFNVDLFPEFIDEVFQIWKSGTQENQDNLTGPETHPSMKSLSQVIRPPICVKCDHYARLNGTHYCGLKECWKIKRAAFFDEELERISQEMGIPIWNKTTESYFDEYGNTWDDNRRKQETEDLKARPRPDHLRVRIRFNEYRKNKYTDSQVVQVGSVRPEFQEEMAAKKEQEAQIKEKAQTFQERYKLEQRQRELVRAFIWEIATPLFGQSLFKGLNENLIRMLGQEIGVDWQRREHENESEFQSPEDEKIFYMRWIAFTILDSPLQGDDYQLGVVAIAKRFKNVATTLAVELPENWLKMAQAFDNNVSTETEK